MDSRTVSSSCISSISENSYGSAKPGKTGDNVHANHDSSEEISGQSPDGSVSQRHTRTVPPKLGKREERKREEIRLLMALPDQSQKLSKSAELRQSKRGSPVQQEQGRTSTHPVPVTVGKLPPLTPRTTSLQSKPCFFGRSRRWRFDSWPGQAVHTQW